MKSVEDIKRYFEKAILSINQDRHEVIFERIQRAHEKSKTPASNRLSIRSNIMKNRMTQLAAAAVIIIAVMLGIHYLGGSPDGVSVAWADVLKNMETAQTVTFTLEWDKQFDDGELEWGKGTNRIKGPYRRADVTGGHRYQDGPIHEEESISIMDLSRQNRFVLLYPSDKLAYYAPDHGGNDSLLTYDGLKKDFRDGTEEHLGKVQIEGQDAICFKVSKDHMEITIWADPDTALPIKIERLATEGIDKTVLSNIIFDIELDDKLFDMSLPEDYVVVNMGTEEFTIPFELTEEYIIEGLAKQAKSHHGIFPTLFMGGRPGKEAFNKHIAETKTALPVEGRGSGMLAAEYLKRLPEGSEWQYMGEDVKIGEANTPVFWYRRAGSKTGRVIYGDLSVKDIASEDLPQAPWPPRQK